MAVSYEIAYLEYRAAWRHADSTDRMHGKDNPEYREALEIFRLATVTLRKTLEKRKSNV